MKALQGMKPGRNDPCHCGSGKKYKHCCLAQGSAMAQDPDTLLWQRIRREIDGLPQRMAAFVLDTYGDYALDEAWGEFTCWDERYGAFDPETPQIAVFMPWLFHCWVPDASDTDVADVALHGMAPTQVYLARKGRRLDPISRAYLEACLVSPFRFFEVLASDPGRELRLREAFSGTEHVVLERSASRSVQAGDLLYAQLARVQGITLLECCSPVVFPPQHKVELIRLRQELQTDYGAEPDPADRADFDAALRGHYLDVSNQLLHPLPPILQNTDGDDLDLQRLWFDIDSPRLAFDRLKHLDLMTSEAELLALAGHDETGRLQRIAFDWHRLGNAVHASWDNTVLGHLEIDGTRLSLQVNSDRRAAEGRRLVEEALGDGGRYRDSEALPFDPAMAAGAGAAMPHADAEDEFNPMQDPGVQAQIAEFMASHFNAWPEQPLPALDGQTPLEAVQDADGREMVEALVRQMERINANAAPPVASSVLLQLRRRLGLAA